MIQALGMRFVSIAITRFTADRWLDKNGGADQIDAALPQIRQADGGNALGIRELLDRGAQHIPSAKGVVRQVKMGVDDHENSIPKFAISNYRIAARCRTTLLPSARRLYPPSSTLTTRPLQCRSATAISR